MKYIQSVRGMHDCLPKEAILWQKIEKILITVLNSYGYNEIRFPIVELTQLFKRSIGQVTDVIAKEMYNFNDQSGNDLTLRPEGTSGCVRACIEHSVLYGNQEQRLWYLGPMFRHERPQKGRYRQFHQCSAEVFGYLGPDIDAELILMTIRCWKKLGIDKYLTLELNSIGSAESRVNYQKKLINFFKKNLHFLNSDHLTKLRFNPLRILDTKDQIIQQLLTKAPTLRDYLDNDSRMHFDKLCQLLDLFNISYTINPYLVRGLDYYNRTVFEWVTHALGTKKTICAGGRYDELTQQLGSKKAVPAVGFAIGLERVLLLMKTINHSILDMDIYIHIYIMYSGEDTQKYAMLLSELIREKLPYLRLMVDYGGRDLTKQFSRAIKNNSSFVLVVDNSYVVQKTVILKNLCSGQQEVIETCDLINKLSKLLKII